MITENDVAQTLRKARLYQLSHGHDWDVSDVLPVVMTLLGDVWDDGMRTGTSRAMRHMSDEPNLPLASDADNPYRSPA